MFTTKYTKGANKTTADIVKKAKSGKGTLSFTPKKGMKFKKGGIVPRVGGKASDNYFDPREDEHRLQDVEVTTYQKAGERDRASGENRFFDSGTRIPGWQAGKNDAYRERMGFKRLKDEDK